MSFQVPSPVRYQGLWRELLLEMPFTRSRWLFALLVTAAFVAGGLSPARADNTDRIVQLLDRMADALRDIAHREPVKVICECKGG